MNTSATAISQQPAQGGSDAHEPSPCLVPATDARTRTLDATRASASATFLQHQHVLQGVALRLCGSRADAHDLVQDTFERALRASSTQTPENPRAWLLTILYNLFIHQRRRQSRQPLVPLTPEHLDVAERHPEVEPEWASISQDQIAAALSQLEEPFRRVYELHCLSHASYDQIAALLGIPRNTVGTRLMRARRKVRALLRSQLAACNDRRDHDRAA